MPRLFVKCRFHHNDARLYSYHYDGEEPLQVGDTVKVPDRSGDGWKRVEVVSITDEEPPFPTKGIIGRVDDEPADEPTTMRDLDEAAFESWFSNRD